VKSPRSTHPWMPTAVKGQYFYWYMMLDVFSRKIVGHEVHVAESAELAALFVNCSITACARIKH
jgi:transposase InsO family protein